MTGMGTPLSVALVGTREPVTRTLTWKRVG